jgi:hypothetical protein
VVGHSSDFCSPRVASRTETGSENRPVYDTTVDGRLCNTYGGGNRLHQLNPQGVGALAGPHEQESLAQRAAEGYVTDGYMIWLVVRIDDKVPDLP